MKYYIVSTTDGLKEAFKQFKNNQECAKWIAKRNKKGDHRWTWSENYIMNLGAQ